MEPYRSGSSFLEGPGFLESGLGLMGLGSTI